MRIVTKLIAVVAVALIGYMFCKRPAKRPTKQKVQAVPEREDLAKQHELSYTLPKFLTSLIRNNVPLTPDHIAEIEYLVEPVIDQVGRSRLKSMDVFQYMYSNLNEDALLGEIIRKIDGWLSDAVEEHRRLTSIEPQITAWLRDRSAN